MKIKKEWWYVVAIVVIIILLIVVFRSDIGFSPRNKFIKENTDYFVSESLPSIARSDPDSNKARNFLEIINGDVG